MNLKLFYLVTDDDQHDSFVRAASSSDAVDYWKQVFPGMWDDDTKLQVIEVPCESGVVGVIPWDTLKMDEIEP